VCTTWLGEPYNDDSYAIWGGGIRRQSPPQKNIERVTFFNLNGSVNSD